MHRPIASAMCSAVLALATVPSAVQAATEVYGPGEWHFTTPTLFAPDDVLELQIIGVGGPPCVVCSPIMVFEQGVSFAGTLRVTMEPAWFFYAGQTYTLFSYWTSPPVGHFGHVDLPALPAGLAWNTDSLYNSGTIQVQQPVPEPAVWALWLGGTILMGVRARRRKP